MLSCYHLFCWREKKDYKTDRSLVWNITSWKLSTARSCFPVPCAMSLICSSMTNMDFSLVWSKMHMHNKKEVGLAWAKLSSIKYIFLAILFYLPSAHTFFKLSNLTYCSGFSSTFHPYAFLKSPKWSCCCHAVGHR